MSTGIFEEYNIYMNTTLVSWQTLDEILFEKHDDFHSQRIRPWDGMGSLQHLLSLISWEPYTCYSLYLSVILMTSSKTE